MEPEQLKTLRKKITTLEHQPVSWQKEFVWQEVAHKSGGQPLAPRWSYAAALLLAGMIGYFMHSDQQRNQDAAVLRISFLEKEIEARENKTVINQNNKEEACHEEKNNIIFNPSSNSPTKKNMVLHEDQPVFEQELVAINISDSIIISTNNFEPVAMVVVDPPLKAIVPIIGKIPQRIPDPSIKERTVRIRLQKKENPELPASQEERHVLVARIN